MITQIFGIRDVSERTGLSPETLRWDERQVLIPRMSRGSDGRRAMDPSHKKVDHCARLIGHGLDCGEQPITDLPIRDEQRRTP